jgi:hypothetical protein
MIREAAPTRGRPYGSSGLGNRDNLKDAGIHFPSWGAGASTLVSRMSDAQLSQYLPFLSTRPPPCWDGRMPNTIGSRCSWWK